MVSNKTLGFGVPHLLEGICSSDSAGTVAELRLGTRKPDFCGKWKFLEISAEWQSHPSPIPSLRKNMPLFVWEPALMNYLRDSSWTLSGNKTLHRNTILINYDDTSQVPHKMIAAIFYKQLPYQVVGLDNKDVYSHIRQPSYKWLSELLVKNFHNCTVLRISQRIIYSHLRSRPIILKCHC